MIETIFNKINVHNIMYKGNIVAIICICLTLIIGVTSILLQKKGILTEKAKKYVKISLFVMLIIAFLTTISILITSISYEIAIKHGAYTDDMSIYEMYKGIKYSPVEDELPEDLTGCIILYYRFDCPDCHAVYKDLKATVNSKDNIYWISSRSEQGKALLARYPVNEVPSGIYFRNYTYGGALTYTKKILYTKDENNNITLNTANINRLLELQDETQ